MEIKRSITRLFGLILLAISLHSCKTIEIKEEWAFMKSQYKLENFERGFKNQNETNKQTAQKVYHLITNTQEEKLLEQNEIFFSRHFIKNATDTTEYFIFQPQNPTKTAVFFMGNGSSIADYIPWLQEMSKQSQTSIYIPNYKGSGNSTGEPKFHPQFEINNNFITHIEEEHHQKVDFLIGYSLGTVFASKVATEKKIPNLILLAPFSDAESYFEHYKKRNTRGILFIFRPFINFTAEDHLLKISTITPLKKYTGNLLLIHGTKDKILPYSMSEKIFQEATTPHKELLPVKNGSHGAPFYKDVWQNLIDYIKNK